jgi:hypothetical protein
MPTDTSILERIIEPKRGGFSSEHARYVLSLDFSPKDHARYAKLAQKVQNGNLTQQEESKLDEFVAANALLTILQSKARISLKKHRLSA